MQALEFIRCHFAVYLLLFIAWIFLLFTFCEKDSVSGAEVSGGFMEDLLFNVES